MIESIVIIGCCILILALSVGIIYGIDYALRAIERDYDDRNL